MALKLVARVHPVVLLSIVDSYERRNEGANRVIGTLLGMYDKGAVEITHSFCVPHTEFEDEVAVDLDFAKNMYELHKKVNVNEIIVGWYATGHDITEQSVLIHEYYMRETTQAIHLTVDTTLNNGRMGIKAYISTPMGVPGKTNGTMFTPLPIEISNYGPEIIAVNLAQKCKYTSTSTVALTKDLDLICTATKKLLELLDTVTSYVNDVIAGRIQPDNSIGRALLDMVNSVPQMDPDEFEAMLNSNMKDLLMVMYLSQLTQAQLTLSEKIVSV
ncbi:Eukaryotic translation initiation factor 3 subunit F [Chamberlinius hualienensis]